MRGYKNLPGHSSDLGSTVEAPSRPLASLLVSCMYGLQSTYHTHPSLGKRKHRHGASVPKVWVCVAGLQLHQLAPRPHLRCALSTINQSLLSQFEKL